MLKFMIHEVRALRKELDPNAVIEKRPRPLKTIKGGATGKVASSNSSSSSGKSSEDGFKVIKKPRKERIIQEEIINESKQPSGARRVILKDDDSERAPRSYTPQSLPSTRPPPDELFKPIAPAPPTIIRVIGGKRVDTSIVIPVPTSRPSSATQKSRDIQELCTALRE